MNQISDILYWISTGLLVPVIILLILLFLKSLLMAGTFFGQYCSNRKSSRLVREKLDSLTYGELDALRETLPGNSTSMLIKYTSAVIRSKDNPANVNRLLSDFQTDAEKDMASSKILTKMGPILGLMGTLIPMGPALAGLASGDISSMAYNMQIAFATTVVGLFAGAVGLLTQQTKQRWYRQDLTCLEYLADIIDENREKETNGKTQQ